MARLPIPGADTNVWGALLNEWLLVAHAPDGTALPSTEPATPGIPSGTVIDFAGGGALPAGYVDCDGASYLRTTYPDLFAAIGTAWGAVDGTHFNVPDLRGRVTVAKGTPAQIATVGLTEGAAVGGRGPHHRHTVTDPTHNHGHTDPTHSHRQTVNANTGGSGGLTNIQRTSEQGGAPSDRYTEGAATGIVNVAAGTGITVGYAAGPLDGPAFGVLRKIIHT